MHDHQLLEGDNVTGEVLISGGYDWEGMGKKSKQKTCLCVLISPSYSAFYADLTSRYQKNFVVQTSASVYFLSFFIFNFSNLHHCFLPATGQCLYGPHRLASFKDKSIRSIVAGE